jgi:hypothetical protein
MDRVARKNLRLMNYLGPKPSMLDGSNLHSPITPYLNKTNPLFA